MIKKKWMFGIGIGVILLAGGGYGFTQYQTHAKAEEKQQALLEMQTKLDKKVEAYKQEAASFYLNEKKELLAKDVTNKRIRSLEKKFDELTNQKMTESTAAKLNTAIMDAGYARNMLIVQTKVNALLDEKGVLIEKADISEVKKLLQKLKEVKPVFYTEQNKILKEAVQQQNQLDKAKRAVRALFTSDDYKTVKETVTQSQFQTALVEKNKVKQPKTKQELIKALNKVEQYLTNKEKQQQAIENENINQSESTSPPTKQENNPSTPTQKETKSSDSKSHRDTSSSSSTYTSPNTSNRSDNQPTTRQAPNAKTHESTTQPSKGHTSSGSNKSSTNGNSNSGSEMKPGDSWNGSSTNKGGMESDSGREWGTIDW